MNKEAIKQIIPHRDPMLLIYEVLEMNEGKDLTAKFYIDESREIFKGHFPGEPVFPGVYTVECMAQAADILLLSMEKYKGTIPFFIGINNVSFKAKIKPGDEIVIKVALTKDKAEKSVGICSAQVYNDEVLAATGDVVLAMR